jgi:hypothetical protein
MHAHNYVYRENIHNRRYQTADELIADIELIYANCLLYNDDKSPIGRGANRQRAAFRKYLQRLQRVGNV